MKKATSLIKTGYFLQKNAVAYSKWICNEGNSCRAGSKPMESLFSSSSFSNVNNFSTRWTRTTSGKRQIIINFKVPTIFDN